MRSELLKLTVISKYAPRSPASLSSQLRSSLAEDGGSQRASLWYGNVHTDPCWRTCQPREPTALGGSLRLKGGEQNSSGLWVHFLPPHFCLKFCFSSGVLFPISHSSQCLGKSLSIFKSKISEAAVQAWPPPKNVYGVKCINIHTKVWFGRWVLYALPMNNSEWWGHVCFLSGF